MKSIKQNYYPSCVTQTIQRGRTTLYLVLKEKPLIEKILGDVKEEAEKRFNAFIQSNIPLLQSLNPDDPLKFLECFLLRGLIKILDEMFAERNVKLSLKDKNEINSIFEKEFGEGFDNFSKYDDSSISLNNKRK